MAAKAGFIGTGILGPLTLSEGRGIALSSGEQDVAQSVRLILSTRPGERVMRPAFGCRIHEYVFAPNNSNTHTKIREAVKDALETNEPRIQDVEVEVKGDPNEIDRLNVRVKYRIRTINSIHNLVYPFYLQGS
ncbi:MAG: GPW/gp25 family protein [Myxococcota bacterium]